MRRRGLLFASEKSDGYITVHPVAAALTYNGEAQALASTGSGSGTMMYSLDNSSFSNTMPTGVNAGDYTLYYKCLESARYFETSVYSIACNIAKASGNVTLAPTTNSLTYNATAQTLATEGAGTGTMYYRLGDSGDFSTTVPSSTNAGSWTMYYYAAESSNYTQSDTGSISVSMNKADISPSVSMSGWTYGGTAQNPTVSGNSGSGTVTYSYKISTDADSTYTTTKPSNAGTYTVRAVIDATTNYNGGTATNTFTIAKAAGSVTTAPANTGYAYNGTARALASAGSGTGTMYYRLGTSGNFSTSIPTASAPGSWTLYYYAAASTNYNQSSTGSITVTQVKASQNAPTATGATVTYPATATASASGGGGQGSIEWSNGSSRSAVGSQNTQARWSGNTYYNASGWSTAVTLKVNQATGSVTTAPTNRGVAYTGGNQNLVNAGSGTGTMYYRLGTSGSFTTSIPVASAVGSYTVYYYAAASTNYTQSATGSVTATIVKANQNAPTATGATTTYPTTATATASGGGGQGTLTWTNGNTQTSVGSKSTQAYWAGNGNYNASAKSNAVTLTMNKAAGSVTTAPTNKASKYTGSAVALVNAGAGTGTMYYRNGTSGSFSTSIPTSTNIGSYTVYYYAAASTNYNQSSTGSVTATIVSPEGFLNNPIAGSTSISYSTSTSWRSWNYGLQVDIIYTSGYASQVKNANNYSIAPASYSHPSIFTSNGNGSYAGTSGTESNYGSYKKQTVILTLPIKAKQNTKGTYTITYNVTVTIKGITYASVVNLTCTVS